MKKLNLFQFGTTIVLFVLCLLVFNGYAQNVVYQENFGLPTANTPIQSYTGWQDTVVSYWGNGTCDVRSSSASSGYGLASGGGNVMINDTTKWFMVAHLSTALDSNLSLYCGLRKTANEDGRNFKVEVSTDSVSWTRLWMQDSLPSGTGTSGWYRVRYPQVPSCNDLYIRFSNLASVDYRLDDIAIVVGEEQELRTVEKPQISPNGGVFYEPQTVTISCPTPGSEIHYTMDGSTPTAASNRYLGPLTINSNVVLKAMAVADGMFDSEVTMAQFTILDTNSLVVLPFDISTNSTTTREDITLMDGFRGSNLGSSYQDGSVKFEAAQAGRALLVAHLDSAPQYLMFDMKGKNGGSNPAAYIGIQMEISESADGQSWNTVAILTEQDISVDDYIRFNGYVLQQDTRFIRWKLLSASKGNTQLNNISISKYVADSVAVMDYQTCPISVYPNPTNGAVHVVNAGFDIQYLALYSLDGRELRRWEGPVFSSISLVDFAPGMYVLQVGIPQGVVKKKVVKF